MNNVLIVTNSFAGRKQAIKYRKRILKFLLKRNISCKSANIDELSEIDIAPFDTILTVGGDGTVNKVLPYLINTDKTLGIIPSGTANLLAAKLGINGFSKALKILDKGNIIPIDVMSVNNQPSILRFGLGFDADIIAKTPQSLKNKFGYFSYFIAGIIFALRLKNKEYVLTLDNQKRVVNASCIIVANAANMFQNLFVVANENKLNDGLFDVFILKTQNPILFFVEFLKIMINLRCNNSRAEYIKADNLGIENKYCLSHIDGEKMKFTENLEFKINKNTVKVYAK